MCLQCHQDLCPGHHDYGKHIAFSFLVCDTPCGRQNHFPTLTKRFWVILPASEAHTVVWLTLVITGEKLYFRQHRQMMLIQIYQHGFYMISFSLIF